MAQAQEYMNQDHDGETLNALRDDYARYQYCWRRAIHFRSAWYDGQRNLVASTLASTHARYADATRGERVKNAKLAWCASAEAQDIAEAEQQWHRWALGHLAAWQATSLNQLAASVTSLVDVLRANGG
jgi:hypothetical protein